MTRSFLSTSEKRSIVAELFINCDSFQTHPPVMCVYKIKNPKSSISIKRISQMEDEEEVLIHPFSVFEVTKQMSAELIKERVTYTIQEIHLEESEP